jgi:hypothetical protein
MPLYIGFSWTFDEGKSPMFKIRMEADFEHTRLMTGKIRSLHIGGISPLFLFPYFHFLSEEAYC